MDKGRKIILCGHGASGKDHLRARFEKQGFKYGVTFTSRPPRKGEVDGKDYGFITRDQFQELIDGNCFLEYVEFNNWYYGTPTEIFNESDLFIMNREGINKLSKEQREVSFIIFLDMPEDLRRERMSSRNDNNDSVDRRIKADNADFEGFTDFDLRIDTIDF